MFDLHLQDFQRNPSVLLRLQPGEGPQPNRRSLGVAAKKKYMISECGLEGRCLQRRGAGKRLPSREIEDEDEDDYRETIEERGES